MVPQRVNVSADMVASVVRPVAKVGEAVGEGDALVLVESMKMEIPVLAPTTGTVVALHAEPGEVVEEGDLLAVIEAE
jgi:acetyl-CoA carboxylase biotin carboxyl carrier protein